MYHNDKKWPLLIATLVQVKQQLADVDGGLWPHHLPNLKASESAIEVTEGQLGFRLPSSYREFLLHANGWKGLFQSIDLLGCDELCGGRHHEYFWEMYGSFGREEWTRLRLSPAKLLPIAGSLQDRDAIVLDLDQPRGCEYEIVWLAGERIDEWSSFGDFFASMIEYNRREIEFFTSQAGLGSNSD